MRQFATGLNRTWLGILGLALLLFGLASVAIGTGVAARLLTSGGLNSGDHLLGAWVRDVFANTAAVIGVGVLAGIVVVLGLAWLLAQIPRTNAATPLRFHDEADGLTTCSPAVLTDALCADVRTLPGVSDADAVLRGTADRPELTLRLNADERTDIPALLHQVQDGPAANLRTALGVPLSLLAVQVDISPAPRTADRVSL